jgi:hypothetical protein
VAALADRNTDGVRVRFRVVSGAETSTLALTPPGFTLTLLPDISAHDGANLDTLAPLAQVGTDVRIRFRIQNILGAAVDVDSLEYFIHPDNMTLFTIPLADVAGAVTNLATAVDLAGPEHELIWSAANDPSLDDAITGNLRVRLVLRQGMTLSDVADSPAGFTLNTMAPILNVLPQNATEDIPFVSAPIAIGDPTNVDFDALDIPAWLEFDSQTAQLSGTPENADVGSDTVRVSVSLNNGPPALAELEISVGNTPPSITSNAPRQTLLPGERFTYDVVCDDEGSGNTLYSLTEAPEFLTIDATTGLITGVVPEHGISNGQVTVRVTDGNGGSTTQTFTLDGAGGPLTVEAGASVTILPGASVGLSATAAGGTTPYRFVWSNGVEGSATVVTPGVTSSYSVIALDSEDRMAADDVLVVVAAPLEVSVAGDRTVVTGDETTLTAIISGGTPPYGTLWSTGDESLSVIVSPDRLESVTVTVLDAMGAGAVELVRLDTVDVLAVEIGLADTEELRLRANVSGGLGPYDVVWSTGERRSDIALDSVNVDSIVSVVVIDALDQFATASAEASDFGLVEAPLANPAPSGSGSRNLCGMLGLIPMSLVFAGLATLRTRWIL